MWKHTCRCVGAIVCVSLFSGYPLPCTTLQAMIVIHNSFGLLWPHFACVCIRFSSQSALNLIHCFANSQHAKEFTKERVHHWASKKKAESTFKTKGILWFGWLLPATLLPSTLFGSTKMRGFALVWMMNMNLEQLAAIRWTIWSIGALSPHMRGPLIFTPYRRTWIRFVGKLSNG